MQLFQGKKMGKRSLDLGVFPWNDGDFTAFQNVGKQIAMLSS